MGYTGTVTQSFLADIRRHAALGACTGIVGAWLAGCASAPAAPASAAISERGSAASAWQGAPERPGWAPFRRLAATDGWFDVYRITPRVFALYEPGQFEEVISYLVVGDERAVLFDTGLGIGDIRALTAQLTNRPITVINSHAHYDHIGGNHQFEDIRAGVTEFTLARASGADNDVVRDYVSAAWLSRPLPAGVTAANYRIRPYATPQSVDDGDRIDLGGITLEVVTTPGHTNDALCLLDRERGLLFTGDTFYPAPLYTHTDGAGLAVYQRSAERLAELAAEVRLILPGHNEPVADAAVLGRVARAFRQIRSGLAPDATPDGLNEYRFDGFSVLVRPGDLATE